MSAGMDLDPVFVRALRLLHSKSKDSASQLKAMVDDCFRQPNSPHLSSKSGNSSSSSSSSHMPKKESEKRSLDKLVRDLSELVPTSKKPRLDSPGSSKSHTPSPAPTSPGFFEKGSTGSRSVQSGSSSSAEELDVDLNLEGLNDLTCYICKQLHQENGNKLMECHTCQNLYHQECHIPAVSNEEAADPRLVWNCSDCSKTMASSKPATLSKQGPKSSSNISSLKSARASPSKLENTSSSSALKRADQKFNASTSSTGNKPAGLASLAVSYKSNMSSSSNRSSNSRSGIGISMSSNLSSTSNSNLLTADKRLQMMKKKAAQRKVR